jgi:hypothetical protein
VITAQVSDSGGLSDQIAIGITVNVAPTVAITGPPDGTTVNEGTAVTLTGTASDPEQGDLSASLVWSSDVDGALGTGASVSPTLSPGPHVITAQVTDGGGLSDQITIGITVNARPIVTITAPPDGTTVNEGTAATLTGTASDPEQGDLTSSIVWSSDVDGALGTGASVSPTLSPGPHVIMAQVTDGGGLSDQIAIGITVNATPTVAISAPAHGSNFAEGESVALVGTASDFEDGDVTSVLTWSSDLDGDLGTGGSLVSNLSLGLHTITAEATDSAGLAGGDSIVIAMPEPAATLGLAAGVGVLLGLARLRRRRT